jgi:branched-chain amino acid aminotransferase
MKISYNGALVDIEGAPCTEAGWLVGAGIFETLRTVNGLAYAFSRHLDRAKKSALIKHLELPNPAVIESAVNELLMTEPLPDGLLRISFDKSGSWAAVHLPYEPPTVPAKVRIHPQALISHGETIKSYPYGYRLAILEEAKSLGFDEAIIASTEGNICEGAVSNIIFLVAGKWITPPTSDGVLPGIMRGLVLDYCDVKIVPLHMSLINNVESAILLSSLRIAQPIESIDGRTLQLSQTFTEEIQAMAVLHSVG